VAVGGGQLGAEAPSGDDRLEAEGSRSQIHREYPKMAKTLPRGCGHLRQGVGVNVGAGDGAGAGGPLVAVRARRFAEPNGWNQFQNRGLAPHG
jgi:hypothetical protein